MISFETSIMTSMEQEDLSCHEVEELRTFASQAKGNNSVINRYEYNRWKHLLTSLAAVSFAQKLFTDHRRIKVSRIDQSKIDSVCYQDDDINFIDSDGDTIKDSEDLCPDIPGVAYNLGCLALPEDRINVTPTNREPQEVDIPDWQKNTESDGY